MLGILPINMHKNNYNSQKVNFWGNFRNPNSHKDFNKKTSFGWKFSTHRFITSKVVSKYNKLLEENHMKILKVKGNELFRIKDSKLFAEKYKEILNISINQNPRMNKMVLHYSCVEPDHWSSNNMHKHFADVDNPKEDDALSFIIEHTKEALRTHRIGDYENRDNHIGLAIHGLDMLNPFHAIIFKILEKNSPERVLHSKFEKIAEQNQGLVLRDITIDDSESQNLTLKEYLFKSMKKAKEQHEEIERIGYTKIEDKDLKRIAAAALENTYKATDVFFKKLTAEFMK